MDVDSYAQFFSEEPGEWKKQKCLKIYFDRGDALWEDVVEAVNNIGNTREAKAIAEKYINKKDEL